MLDLRRLRSELQALQSELRPLVARVEELCAIEGPTDEQAAELSQARDRAAELVTQIEAKRVEISCAEDELDDQRARQAAMAPARARVQVIDNTPDPAQTGGYDDIAQLAIDVHRAMTGQGISERLQSWQRQAATMTTRGEEGFSIPPAFRGGMIELVFGLPGIVGEVDSEPTNAPSITMDADESTPWGTDGVQVYWTGEGKQIPESSLVSQARVLTVDPLKALVRYSDELADDAPRLAAKINRKVPEKLNWVLAEAIVRGNGVKRPLGFLDHPATPRVEKEAAGNGAGTIIAANVKKMYARQLIRPGASYKWYAHIDTFPALDSLSTADDPRPRLTFGPNGQVYLMGLPLEWTELCDTVGETGDLILANPRGYYAAVRAAIQSAQSMHIFFDTGEQAWRFTLRVGGQPKLSKATKSARGTVTKGDFIALAKRN